MSVKNKRTLNKIAKEWCKGILLACETDAFEDSLDSGILDTEEVYYIVNQAHEVAKKITKEHPENDINLIINKYFTLE